jgi:hypothetical protein
MRGAEFQGYAKPVLRVRNGALVTENVPVPQTSHRFPWLRQHALQFSKLRTMELARVLLETARGGTRRRESIRAVKVAVEIFKSLRQLADTKGALLVLAVLPGPDDYRAEAPTPGAPRCSRIELQGFRRIDLVEELRRLPPRRSGLSSTATCTTARRGTAGWRSGCLRLCRPSRCSRAVWRSARPRGACGEAAAAR